jgi:hypothetical protein
MAGVSYRMSYVMEYSALMHPSISICNISGQAQNIARREDDVEYAELLRLIDPEA